MLDNVLYTEYVDQDEREFAMAYEAVDISISKGIAALHAICEKEELDERTAELKCFQESGDMDRLTDLYQEAKDGTSDKKEGILSTIWNGIKNIFAKIRDFITGKSKKIDPNKDYQCDSKALEGLNKVGNAMKSFATNPKKVIATIAVIAGTYFAVTKTGAGDEIKTQYTKVKGSVLIKAKDIFKDIEGLFDSAIEQLKKLPSVLAEKFKSSVDAIKAGVIKLFHTIKGDANQTPGNGEKGDAGTSGTVRGKTKAEEDKQLAKKLIKGDKNRKKNADENVTESFDDILDGLDDVYTMDDTVAESVVDNDLVDLMAML